MTETSGSESLFDTIRRPLEERRDEVLRIIDGGRKGPMAVGTREKYVDPVQAPLDALNKIEERLAYYDAQLNVPGEVRAICFYANGAWHLPDDDE